MPLSDPPAHAPTGGPAGAGGLLTIDLGAVADNYRLLGSKLAGGAECAAVVKANAYGLGLSRVAPALAAAGCRKFFVALAEEAITLRRLLPDVAIYVFNGADADSAPLLSENGAIPVLNHAGQVADWRAEATRLGQHLPAMLHADTGMNRLGFGATELDTLLEDTRAFEGLALEGVMSHLACAEEKDHPLNAEQLTRFRRARARLSESGPVTASLANSSGIFLGADYHFDLARPGAALYGVAPQPDTPNPMAQVIRLQGKILQTRLIDTPMTVGYGATHPAERGRRIATVGVGYGDGYFRILSGLASAHIGRTRVPVVGRVSMDLITLDVTGIPEGETRPGQWVDLIGPEHPVDALAREAKTIGYEILTALGARYARRYVGGDSL